MGRAQIKPGLVSICFTFEDGRVDYLMMDEDERRMLFPEYRRAFKAFVYEANGKLLDICDKLEIPRIGSARNTLTLALENVS